jgi:hypothetical protein
MTVAVVPPLSPGGRVAGPMDLVDTPMVAGGE